MNIFISIFRYILIIIVICTIASCKNNSYNETENTVQSEKIVYSQVNLTDLRSFNNDDYKIVMLSNLNDDCLFSNNSKTIIQDSIIYILDRSNKGKKLVKYDINGDAIGRVGRLGNGPSEYITITDFDIDSEGNIYLLDGRQDVVLVYNSNANFLYRKAVNHKAFALKKLNDGCYLLGIYPWDDKIGDKYSVIKVDSNFNTLKGVVRANKDFDPNCLFFSSEITRNSQGLYSSNYEINNEISIINSNGDLNYRYLFDFEESNVPDEEKKNVDGNTNLDNYRFLTGGTYHNNNYLWINLFDRGQFKWVRIDLKNNCGISMEIKQQKCLVGFHNDYPIITSNYLEECPIQISDSIKHLVEFQEYQFVAIHK